jgi:hypothetical protein
MNMSTVEKWQPPVNNGGLYENSSLPEDLQGVRFEDLSPEDQERYRSAIRFGGYRPTYFEQRPR